MTSPFGLLRASLINNNPGMAQSKPKHDGPETDKKSTSAHRPSMRQLKDRWGDELVEAGWVGLPTTLLERQRALGLDAIDVTIILHIAKHWWDAGSLPFPSKRSIAQMMGIHPRTVQKRIADMEKGGLIARIERRGGPGSKGSLSSQYDLRGLREKATPLAREALTERARVKREREQRIARKRPVAERRPSADQ